MMHPRKKAIEALTSSLKKGELDRAKSFERPPAPAGLDDAPVGDMTKDSGDMEPDSMDPHEGMEGEHEQEGEGPQSEEAKIGMEHVDALKALLEKM